MKLCPYKNWQGMGSYCLLIEGGSYLFFLWGKNPVIREIIFKKSDDDFSLAKSGTNSCVVPPFMALCPQRGWQAAPRAINGGTTHGQIRHYINENNVILNIYGVKCI